MHSDRTWLAYSYLHFPTTSMKTGIQRTIWPGVTSFLAPSPSVHQVFLKWGQIKRAKTRVGAFSGESESTVGRIMFGDQLCLTPSALREHRCTSTSMTQCRSVWWLAVKLLHTFSTSFLNHIYWYKLFSLKWMICIGNICDHITRKQKLFFLRQHTQILINEITNQWLFTRGYPVLSSLIDVLIYSAHYTVFPPLSFPSVSGVFLFYLLYLLLSYSIFREAWE